MKKRLLYATTNLGKIFEVGRYVEQFGIKLLSPEDIGLKLEVEEGGKTLEENAAAKAKAYVLAGFEGMVMADYGVAFTSSWDSASNIKDSNLFLIRS